MALGNLSVASEKKLAKEASEGNQAAVAELITQFQPYIAKVVRTCRIPESDFDDVCQEVNIAITKSIETMEQHCQCLLQQTVLLKQVHSSPRL